MIFETLTIKFIIMKHAIELSTNFLEVGEDIGLQEGSKLVKAFKNAYPDAVAGFLIGKNILQEILSQPGCVGINFRKCLSHDNQEHLVYTGVDDKGKDIIEYTVVTNTGKIMKKDAIVADKTIWIDDDIVLPIIIIRS